MSDKIRQTWLQNDYRMSAGSSQRLFLVGSGDILNHMQEDGDLDKDLLTVPL